MRSKPYMANVPDPKPKGETMPKSENKHPLGGLHKPTVNPDSFPAMGLYSDDVELDSFVCNFDPAEPSNAGIMFACQSPATRKVADLVGSEIAVMCWCCRKMQLPAKGGESGDVVVMTTLIEPDGFSYVAMSRGVVRSIDLLRQHAADEPFNPPIRLRVVASDVGQGADMLMLAPVPLG